ncbi:LLM class flavin-dependent oxidoreductase [Amycolatopsis bartoniae]|nr:LLM class flavin-dependent oxidoreductase [Amycolatopsis bartoniae]
MGAFPVVDGARAAEELGFDTAWAGDHLVFHPPLLEAACALSAAAAVTSRIRLGFGVLLLPLRQLVWAAKQLTTIGALAPGRLVLGVGVGGEHPAEFEAAGVPLSERGRRLDEALRVLPDLLLGRPVGHDGEYLRITSPALAPALPALPPVVVGGRSDAALRRAARHGDGWLAMWLGPDRIAESAARLDALAAHYGRPAPEVKLLVIGNIDEDEDTAREQTERLLWSQYRLPLRVVDRWSVYGPAEKVAARLAEYRAAGVTEFALLPAGDDPLTQFSRWAEVRERVNG